MSDSPLAVVLQFALPAIPAILAITLHEAAHGYAALAMGDDTARLAGRLSLNPLRHVDRVGTIIVPAVLFISQYLAFGRAGIMFGWAKPVPVAAWKFRSPRRGMMFVAAAGPAMNFFLAWLGALLRHITIEQTGYGILADDFLQYFILYNLALGLFNLLPVPPLDGGRIMVGLLPERAAIVWARLERVGLVLVILTVAVLPSLLGEFGIRFDPIGTVLRTVLPRAFDLIDYLAGLHDN